MSNVRGYSTKLAGMVAEADPSLPTIRLARICIAKEIPVTDVAETLGVTRMTVYKWFKGLTAPRPKQLERIMEILARLEVG